MSFLIHDVRFREQFVIRSAYIVLSGNLLSLRMFGYVRWELVEFLWVMS